jgi:predicted metal-binding membrane protein
MHLHAEPTTGFAPLALTWMGMMAAMMAPAAWPWVHAFARLTTDAGSPLTRATATAAFTGGYLAAWTLYAAGAALLQMAASRWGLLDSAQALTPALGAAVLLAAGAFQFAALKRACLTHCRSPFGYFLSRWRNGHVGGLRMGFEHGLFCVGCCWAIMATVFAVGLVNVWWMAALAALAFAEQVVPVGDRLRVATGVVLIAAGLARL